MSGLLAAREQLSAPLRRLRQIRGTWLLARGVSVQRLREFHWVAQRLRKGGGSEEDLHAAIDHAAGLAPCEGTRLLSGAVSFRGEPAAPRLTTPPVAPRLKKKKRATLHSKMYMVKTLFHRACHQTHQRYRISDLTVRCQNDV